MRRWTTTVCAGAILASGCAQIQGTFGSVERTERGQLVIEGIPDIPEGLSAALRRYENTRSATLSDWMTDGRGNVVSTRFGETSQIHRVATPGGARHQITFFAEPVGGASVCPDPEVRGFLFSKDVGGSEFYQLFFHDLATGAHRMLTDGVSRNGGAAWSNAGDRFAFYTTKRNGQDWDVHVMSLDGEPGDSRPVLEEGGVWAPMDWSPDDRRLLVLRYVSINESDPYVLELASGELTPLAPSDEKVAFGGAAFSKDGAGVYFTSDHDSEFRRLRYLESATGRVDVLTDDIPWDVEGFELSSDGRWLAFSTNEDGMSRLRVLETGSRRPLAIPPLPAGRLRGMAFSPSGDRLAFSLETARSPTDVYSVDIEDGAELVRWTTSEMGGLRRSEMVAPELVHFETFDEVDGRPRRVPAFYYRPRGEGPFGVVVDIHGGPESQARPGFSPRTQFYVNELDLAVLVPNVRGSAGYGRSYLLLDNGYRREDSVKDVGALLDWIETRPELDADRVAVRGGSYGGYMVLSSMVHYDDRLRAGIDVVGISNFVTFLENTQDYRRDLRRVEYGDERDPEMAAFLDRISPTTNAASIGKPLFVAQGLNDPRVPASESEQMVEVIRDNGGEVWFLLAKDEGHGFRKKSNRDYFGAASALFLKTHLSEDEPSPE